MLATQETNLKKDAPAITSGKPGVSLRSRLLLLILIATLPAVALTLNMSIKWRQHLEANAQHDVLEVARSAVAYHGLLIDETQRVFSLLKDIPSVRNGDPNGCGQLLKELLFGNLHYANFGVIHPNGMVACSGVHSGRPTNLSDRAYFQAVLKTRRLSVGDYQIGRLVKKPVQVIAQPILNTENQIEHIVFAALNLDWLAQLVPTTALPPGSSVTLIDRQGIILARSPDPTGKWTGAHVGNSLTWVQSFIDSGRQEWITEGDGVDGEHRIYALSRLGPTSSPYGYIQIGIPSGPLYAPVNALLLSNSILIGSVFIAIMLLAWFGSDALILKRVRILISATKKIQDGNFSTHATIRGSDEITHLATEFNQMAVMLKKNDDHIRRLNRIHGVLSGINGAILRIRERDGLLTAACQIAVEQGKLRFAWIGMVDPLSGEVHKAAWHGEGGTYIHELCLPTLHRTKNENSPCIMAILHNQSVIHNDVEHEKDKVPFLREAYASGFCSMAAFPLRRDGNSIGFLGLYAGEARFFGDQETDLFLELAADISLGLEYIDKDQHIEHMLYHDALTGLPNRKLCEDRLQQLIARASHHNNRHIGIIVANLTGFRRMSGIYGNHVADQVLNTVAKHLLGQIREGDTIARLEGDEFAIILNDMASMQDAIHLAQAQITSIPSTIQCDQQAVHLTIHAGAAIYPGDGNDARTLLNNATLASTDRKAFQLHSVNFYSREIQQLAQEREQLEHALRHALEEGHELELHYQPVVDIQTHKIVSLEALSRWNSLEFGAVSPTRFIPIAEESGLILSLGDWALATACKQLEAWSLLGINNIRVAVNVSFHQLREAGFIDRLNHVLETMPLCTQNQLAIELTESELMDNIELTITQLEALKERNVITYIDDFGTGYSSLNYLQRLPVHVLKIDQSFIQQLGQSTGSIAIVRTIIALAQSLNLKTIAEGVETREQLAILKKLGCDYIQGYLFSKPKPAAEITKLLEAGGYLSPSI